MILLFAIILNSKYCILYKKLDILVANGGQQMPKLIEVAINGRFGRLKHIYVGKIST